VVPTQKCQWPVEGEGGIDSEKKGLNTTDTYELGTKKKWARSGSGGKKHGGEKKSGIKRIREKQFRGNEGVFTNLNPGKVTERGMGLVKFLKNDGGKRIHIPLLTNAETGKGCQNRPASVGNVKNPVQKVEYLK